MNIKYYIALPFNHTMVYFTEYHWLSMKQCGRNLGPDEYKNMRIFISLTLMMHPTRGHSLKRENKRACLERLWHRNLRCKTFLISYNNVLFVNCSESHLVMICFVPERISGLKLFVFSSYSNSWELADSIRLLLPISCFLKIFISRLSYPLVLEYQNLDHFFLSTYFIILQSVIVFSSKSMSF